MNKSISTNRKEVKFWFSPLIGPNKIFQQENKNNLDEIVVLLFVFKIRSEAIIIKLSNTVEILIIYSQKYWVGVLV